MLAQVLISTGRDDLRATLIFIVHLELFYLRINVATASNYPGSFNPLSIFDNISSRRPNNWVQHKTTVDPVVLSQASVSERNTKEICVDKQLSREIATTS